MSEPEQPWMPGPRDNPWSFALINPNGDRHLAFDYEHGRFYRLWQRRPADPLHTREAILLRPSDIDQIIRLAVGWIINHRDDHRSRELSDEIAAGAKAAVMHFAGLG